MLRLQLQASRPFMRVIPTARVLYSLSQNLVKVPISELRRAQTRII